MQVVRREIHDNVTIYRKHYNYTALSFLFSLPYIGSEVRITQESYSTFIWSQGWFDMVLAKPFVFGQDYLYYGAVVD